MKAKPNLEVVVNRRKLTEDERIKILDKAIDAAEKQLIPLLSEQSSSDVYSAFLRHVHSHMTPELAYIKTGKGLDEPGPAVKKLRELFLSSKAIDLR